MLRGGQPGNRAHCQSKVGDPHLHAILSLVCAALYCQILVNTLPNAGGQNLTTEAKNDAGKEDHPSVWCPMNSIYRKLATRKQSR